MKKRLARVLIVAAMWAVLLGHARCQTSKPAYKDYVVKKNDTLWSIAVRECHNKCDVRTYIDEIRRTNGVGNIIGVGTRLKLREVK